MKFSHSEYAKSTFAHRDPVKAIRLFATTPQLMAAKYWELAEEMSQTLRKEIDEQMAGGDPPDPTTSIVMMALDTFALIGWLNAAQDFGVNIPANAVADLLRDREVVP